jgi:Holliday junction resolvasome RuvABC endonuclease subunit
MPFLGVDQSLNASGLCLVDPDGAVVKHGTLAQKVAQGDTRLLRIREAVAAYLPGVACAAMEGYAYYSTNRAFALGEVGGAVKTVFMERAIKYLIVPPIQVKQFATGHTSADKAEMIAAAAACGVRVTDDNQADAFFLAQIARAYALGTAKRRCELEVIHSLKKAAASTRPGRRVKKVA